MTSTEPNYNYALALQLQKLLPEWASDILPEHTDTLIEATGKHCDILLRHNSIPPVAIETSFLKNDADIDAIKRLGKTVKFNGKKIQTVIAIEWTAEDRAAGKLPDVFRYALHQTANNINRRFPKSGFIKGDIYDLIRLITTTAIPKEVMEQVSQKVTDNVMAAANLLEPIIKNSDLMEISKALYQRSALSGLRTTMILWLDALLVQKQLYGSPTFDIPAITNKPGKCVKCWKIIYAINWKAIFKPAIDILERVRLIAPGETAESLELLVDSVEEIESARLGNVINIGAELFPKIADDRKESAAFYTQASTAELLAALTIPPNMQKWVDPYLFKNFKIADMTCGTGTLLRFGYRQVKMYHLQNLKYDVNMDDTAREQKKTHSLNELHKIAMEDGLYGTDISPIAAHLTSSSLAVDTTQPYGRTHIGWVGVGNENRTGAIEYVASNAVSDLFMDIVGVSAGNKDAASESVEIFDDSMDVVLMNPPYTRSGGVGGGAFDLTGLTEKERKACQDRWTKLIKNEPCNKKAGMSATFLCAARKKVKGGGRIGFVLPRTAAFADTWKKTRGMIENDFKDLTVIAVTSALGREALSADTGMEEMLLVATKKTRNEKTKPDEKRASIRCVTLYCPITRAGESAEIARVINGQNSDDEGAVDGPLMLGDEEIGVSHTFTIGQNGLAWNYVGAVHDTLAFIANELSLGLLYNLNNELIKKIPMTTISELFDVGPTQHMIGHTDGSDYKVGAFKFYKVNNNTDAIGRYRSLWRMSAPTQTRLVIKPTHKGVPYSKSRKDLDRMWGTRSTLFYSRQRAGMLKA